VIKKDRFGLVGKTIASTFRVDAVVAEGGFGVVYRAYHLHFRTSVALKCLKIPNELSPDERQSFLEQFRSEAEIQFRLSSALPHIVRPVHVDAVHTERGEFVPIMALEWLDGQSFEKIIDQRAHEGKRPLSLAETVDLIGPVAQALHQAHNFEADGELLSVVHRDIKPDNLFLTEIAGAKFVKLLDFGISKVRRAATQLAGHVSQTGGQAPFSPAYGAPEQWLPKRFGQTGPWTDVWGLALTLVEIIKGDAVIVGDHQAMMGTALDPKVRPTPRAERVQVSDDVEGVFQKALALDPRYRYQSIQGFWEALTLAMAGDTTDAQSPSGHHIALPKMSAPTPWTPPHLRLQLNAQDTGHLPPMLAPAPLEATPKSQLGGPSYPSNPNSDLHPVLPAPILHAHIDALVIPPIFDQAEPSAEQPITLTTAAESDPSLKLELMPTSIFPGTLADDPSDMIAPTLSAADRGPARGATASPSTAKKPPSYHRAPEGQRSPPSSGRAPTAPLPRPPRTNKP
jgi:eukaryotic-like serine/threonine-protein kinase